MPQYAVLVHSMHIKAEMANLSDDKLGAIMSAAVVKVLDKMRIHMNEQGVTDWQFLSHSLTRLDAHLLLSVLVHQNN